MASSDLIIWSQGGAFTAPLWESPRSARNLRLVLVEAGVRVAPRETTAHPAVEPFVLGQATEETPLAFAARVLRRIHGIARSARRIEQAALFVGPRVDEHAMMARRLLATELLRDSPCSAHLAEFEFRVDSAADAEAQRVHLELVGDLVSSLVRRSVLVRLRFGDETALSVS